MEVKKSQHKYVIGPKGNSLQEILERTGVSVEIPPSDSISETVILRGEPEKLGQALTEVYAKVTASHVGLVCLPAPEPTVQPGAPVAWMLQRMLWPQLAGLLVSQANSFTVSSVSAPSWLHRFIIGKKGQNLAKITQQMPKVREHGNLLHRVGRAFFICC